MAALVIDLEMCSACGVWVEFREPESGECEECCSPVVSPAPPEGWPKVNVGGREIPIDPVSGHLLTCWTANCSGYPGCATEYVEG